MLWGVKFRLILVDKGTIGKIISLFSLIKAKATQVVSREVGLILCILFLFHFWTRLSKELSLSLESIDFSFSFSHLFKAESTKHTITGMETDYSCDFWIIRKCLKVKLSWLSLISGVIIKDFEFSRRCEENFTNALWKSLKKCLPLHLSSTWLFGIQIQIL